MTDEAPTRWSLTPSRVRQPGRSADRAGGRAARRRGARRAAARASRADLVGARRAGRRGRRRVGRPRPGRRAPGRTGRAEQRRVRGRLPRRAAGGFRRRTGRPGPAAAERNAMLRRLRRAVVLAAEGVADLDGRRLPLTAAGLQALADQGADRSPRPGSARRWPPWSTPPARSGEPKAVMLSHRALLAHAEHTAALDFVGPQTTVLGAAAVLRGLRPQRGSRRLAPVGGPAGDHGRLRRVLRRGPGEEVTNLPARAGAALPDPAATSGPPPI